MVSKHRQKFRTKRFQRKTNVVIIATRRLAVHCFQRGMQHSMVTDRSTDIHTERLL